MSTSTPEEVTIEELPDVHEGVIHLLHVTGNTGGHLVHGTFDVHRREAMLTARLGLRSRTFDIISRAISIGITVVQPLAVRL